MTIFIIVLNLCAIVLAGLGWRLSFTQAKTATTRQRLLAISSIFFALIGILLALGDWLIIYRLAFVAIYMFLSFSVARGVMNKNANLSFRNIALDVLGLNMFVIAVWLLAVNAVAIEIYILISFVGLGLLLAGLTTAYLRLITRKVPAGMVNFPTVSLLIPARNEDHVLQECLSNLLKLDYPKLEVIVLDDCSQDRTSEIIAGYANDGVRFVQGNQPGADWTGKNHALERLAEEASGDYMVFCDVDVRFGVSAVTDIINYLTTNNIDMVSVLPSRRHFDLAPNLFVSPYDKFALLTSILPQSLHIAGRSCFALKSEVLENNRFSPYKNSVIPETLLARTVHHELLLGMNFDVTTRKRIRSLIDTHIRLSYPFIFKSVVLACLKFLGSLVLIYIFWLAFSGSVAAIVIAIIYALTNIVTMLAAGYKWSLIGLVGWPVMFLTQVILDSVSMIKYEFGKVEWKSRNVCYPVLARIPRLPRI